MIRERDINLELKITFCSPFMVGSGFGMAGLVDLSTVKGRDGIVYLPGSSIKGRLRSEFKKNVEVLDTGSVCNSLIGGKTEICKAEEIKDACVICRIFGSELFEGSLIFEDAVMDEKTSDILSKIETDRALPLFQSSIRTGIKINRQLKTVDEGALFTIEAANASIILTSRIHGSCQLGDDEYAYLKGTIETITHLGGNKARGMGRCTIAVKPGEISP